MSVFSLEYTPSVIGILIFLVAALLGFGNLAGWWEVSWWVVALVWPIAPLSLWAICVFAVGALTIALTYMHTKK